MPKKTPSKPGSPIPPKNVSAPDAKLIPSEYPLGAEAQALGAWVDAEERRILEETAIMEKASADHHNALKACQEALQKLRTQQHMVAATRHAREDSLRKLHGVGENFRIVGDRLTCL